MSKKYECGTTKFTSIVAKCPKCSSTDLTATEGILDTSIEEDLPGSSEIYVRLDCWQCRLHITFTLAVVHAVAGVRGMIWMSEYAQVVNCNFKGPDSKELKEFIDSENDYPLDIIIYPYNDGSNIVLDLDDDYIQLYELDGKPAVVAQLLELGRLGIAGHILIFDNYGELTRYDIHAYGVVESWINIDDIQYPSSRTYPSNS